MTKQFFVGPTRLGSWRWYAEVDGETVQKGRGSPTEYAAIRAASKAGAATISRYRYAYESEGSLERGDAAIAEVELELGIKFTGPWDELT